MLCEQRSRLVQEYEAATMRFGAAVDRLNRQLLAARKDEYEALLRSADDAHAACERIRRALESHLLEHACRADSGGRAESPGDVPAVSREPACRAGPADNREHGRREI